MAERFITDFKRFFVRGLAAVLPTLLTLWILVQVFRFLQKYIGKYINHGAQWLVVQFGSIISRTPSGWDGPDSIWDSVKDAWTQYHLSWIGIILSLMVIYFFGRFVASLFGRGIWRMIERGFFRMPVVKAIYPYVKQVIDFLLSDKKIEFSRVVAIEYPRKGIWSIGLVTGSGIKTINDRVGPNLLTVFIPSSPTPFTGYTITVRHDEVIDLPLSIDDALRFTVSGGVIVPISEQIPAEQARKGRLPTSDEADEEIQS